MRKHTTFAIYSEGPLCARWSTMKIWCVCQNAPFAPHFFLCIFLAKESSLFPARKRSTNAIDHMLTGKSGSPILARSSLPKRSNCKKLCHSFCSYMNKWYCTDFSALVQNGSAIICTVLRWRLRYFNDVHQNNVLAQPTAVRKRSALKISVSARGGTA